MMVSRQHNAELIQARWGCNRCTMNGTGPNAQALAAQHFDRKGHQTWVEVTRRITYGAANAKARQAEPRLFR